MGNLNEHFCGFRLVCHGQALLDYPKAGAVREGKPGDVYLVKEDGFFAEYTIVRVASGERERLASMIQPPDLTDQINAALQIAAEEDKSEETFPLFEPPTDDPHVDALLWPSERDL